MYYASGNIYTVLHVRVVSRRLPKLNLFHIESPSPPPQLPSSRCEIQETLYEIILHIHILYLYMYVRVYKPAVVMQLSTLDCYM